MGKVKYRPGTVFVGNNNPINSFDEAQRELAQCDACGCDNILGYFTILDVETGDVGLLYYDSTVSQTAPQLADLTAGTFDEWVQWFKDVCLWRAGGSQGARPSEPTP